MQPLAAVSHSCNMVSGHAMSGPVLSCHAMPCRAVPCHAMACLGEANRTLPTTLKAAGIPVGGL